MVYRKLVISLGIVLEAIVMFDRIYFSHLDYARCRIRAQGSSLASNQPFSLPRVLGERWNNNTRELNLILVGNVAHAPATKFPRPPGGKSHCSTGPWGFGEGLVSR
jgi:hypothetical protein